MIKKYVCFSLLLAVIVSSACAAINDEEFIELCRTGSLQEVRAALQKVANANVRDNTVSWHWKS